MNAGRELDVLVAEKVMGWEPAHMDAPVPVNIASAERWRSPDGRYHYLQSSWRNQFFELPAYSTDIAAAWLVVEKVAAMQLFKRTPLHNNWEAVIYTSADPPIIGMVEADTAPLAICLAALKAAGVDV